MSLFWILIGLIGLWAGSEYALRGTLKIAERRQISQGFLGVTVLAIGTDLPELLVAITGSLHQLRGEQASGVIFGNAVGSALTQGSLVLGAAGLFGHLHMSRRTLKRDGVVLIFAIALLALLAFGGVLTRFEGGALLLVYAIYVWTLRTQERRRARSDVAPWSTLWGPLVAVVVGLAVVLGCSELIVDHALVLARERGWDQTVLGLFLLGAGTSLPELALSLGAVIKGRASLAIGNVIGSNVFDLLVPVGLSAVLHPLTVSPVSVSVDLPVLALLSLLALAFFARVRGIQRTEAWVLICAYASFAFARIWFSGG
ncbi:MAG: sodium:calcium antiporter [Planctomycetota bacterium]|nr:MAG: sodium:calcium antiporter [Planctomycetota bacterium]